MEPWHSKMYNLIVPLKIQTSLCICIVWSVPPSLSGCRQWRTLQVCRLSWVCWAPVILYVWLCLVSIYLWLKHLRRIINDLLHVCVGCCLFHHVDGFSWCCADIKGFFRNYVDFCYRVKTVRYPIMKFIWQQHTIIFQLWKFMYLAWICVELCLIEDIQHHCARAHQWRHLRIAFHSATIPLMSSKLLAVRLKKPMLELHPLLVGLFWTFVIQAKFICIIDSISMKDMVPILSIKHQVIHPNSYFHVFYHT